MMSMGFPSFGLTERESEKAERLDTQVTNILLAAGITERFLWTCPQGLSERMISLRVAGREHSPIVQFSESEFAGLSDQDLLARIQAGTHQN
jgi:hypothetical protein